MVLSVANLRGAVPPGPTKLGSQQKSIFLQNTKIFAKFPLTKQSDFLIHSITGLTWGPTLKCVDSKMRNPKQEPSPWRAFIMTGFEVLLSVDLIKENCDKLSGLISRLAERYDEFG